MAVCWAFPAKPAHATAAPEPPDPELPATAICALDAGGNTQRPSTSPAAATAPAPPRPIRPTAGRAGFLTNPAPASRDRRSQPVHRQPVGVLSLLVVIFVTVPNLPTPLLALFGLRQPCPVLLSQYTRIEQLLTISNIGLVMRE